MLSRPLISILIPTYNSAGHIGKAVESVIRQTHTNWELRIQDGGSKDNTLEIVHRYAVSDTRIKAATEKDRGIYDALNKAIEKSKGQWIFFLGSDDTLFDNDVLGKVADAITSAKGIQFIYGNVKLNKSIGFNSDSLIYAGEFHSNRLLTANICHQAIFYHRSLFETFGFFDTKYRLLADWDFNLRCFNRVKHHYLDIIVSNFFVGASSAADNDTAFKNDFVRNMVFHYPYNRRHSYYKKMKRALSQLVLREALSGRLKNAAVAANVLLHQLKPAAKN